MPIPMLKRLFLRGFRSFPAAVAEFDNPTFLVGQNGAGKSNLADAFAFLSEAMTSPLSTVFSQRVGYAAVSSRRAQTRRPLNLGMRAEIADLNEGTSAAHYAFELQYYNSDIQIKRERCVISLRDGSDVWFDRNANKLSSNVDSLHPPLETNALAMPMVGGDSRFWPVWDFLSKMRIYRIDPAVLRGMQNIDNGSRLNLDGSNATSVLREMAWQAPADSELLVDLLGTIVPGTVDIKPKEYGNKLVLELTQESFNSKEIKFESFNLSDGTLRAIGLLTAIFQHSRPKVLLIEEPEATIHPGALGAVLDVLWNAKCFMQVIVTTHSPDILEAKWIEDNHLRVVTWNEGSSQVAQVSDDTREAIRDQLMDAGELMRSGTLFASPADDLFFQGPNKVPLFKGGPS